LQAGHRRLQSRQTIGLVHTPSLPHIARYVVTPTHRATTMR
jgi:hypothetical protein